MRCQTIILLLAVGLCVLTGVSCRGRKPCRERCTAQVAPVCATWKRGRATSTCTFLNRCRLEVHKCRARQNWIVTKQGECQKNSDDCLNLWSSG